MLYYCKFCKAENNEQKYKQVSLIVCFAFHFSYIDFQVKIDVSVKFQTAPKQAPIKLEISQLDEKPKT